MDQDLRLMIGGKRLPNEAEAIGVCSIERKSSLTGFPRSSSIIRAIASQGVWGVFVSSEDKTSCQYGLEISDLS
jgi:hypothetical protein